MVLADEQLDKADELGLLGSDKPDSFDPEAELRSSGGLVPVGTQNWVRAGDL